MKILIVLPALLAWLGSACQQATPASFSRNPGMETNLLETIDARFKKDLASIQGENRKYIADIYRERYEMIKKSLNEHEIITDQKPNAYLSALANEILKSNSFLNPADLRIVFSRSWIANASSMGEGTILFNIGLFHRLENESQAVFVLCHELAHYYLDHGNKNILQYVTTLYSDAFQKELKSIQKSEYRQNQQLESLAKNLSFRNRRHSRQFEQAADSMALELMKNTRYDLNEALSCLGLLDSADKEKFNGRLELTKRFDFDAYHFKPGWIESDMLIFTSEKNVKEEAEKDSLKTHPDCAVRIERLREQVKKYNNPANKKFIVSKDDFELLKQRFDYEILNYCFESKNVSLCLYFTLKMLNTAPGDPWLHSMVGKCLNEIYTRQKMHELGNIVDLPGPHYNEEYNQLLHLIQNLRLREIAAISFYYLQQHQQSGEHEKEFIHVWDTSKENFNANN